jgi:hypothetical protein
LIEPYKTVLSRTESDCPLGLLESFVTLSSNLHEIQRYYLTEKLTLTEFPIIRDYLSDWFCKGFEKMPSGRTNVKKIDAVTKIIKSYASQTYVKETVYKYLTHVIRTEWKKYTII